VSLDANSAVTDDEVQIVAEELARMSGTTWYLGRKPGSLPLVLMDRYRDRVRGAIAALDRYWGNRAALCAGQQSLWTLSSCEKPKWLPNRYDNRARTLPKVSASSDCSVATAVWGR
jgi:hypothetical protein